MYTPVADTVGWPQPGGNLLVSSEMPQHKVAVSRPSLKTSESLLVTFGLRLARSATEAPNAGPQRQLKRCRKVPKTAEKQPDSQPHSEKQLFWMLWVFLRLFLGCFGGTLPGAHSAPFSAVFRLFSRSGVRGLCSWSGRSPPWACNLKGLPQI